ncbi:MAG: rod-binding protein [Alphaproteobacteria bacterium]|jgi:flagellar protein FlgJ|nr:rod-binding protein [Alphaproteobacteria bacterium]
MNIQMFQTPAQKAATYKPSDEQRAKETAKDFEAVFVNQMLNLMQPELQNDAFHAGNAENQFRAFLNDNISEEIAERGGVGLADHIYDELIKLQEASK